LGFFVWFLTVLRFATPSRTPSVSPSVSILFIPDDGSTDRSSVRFGFGRDPDARIFGEGHLVDHVAKLWGQFHEGERLLGFLTRVGVLCFLLLWCLFGCFLGSVSKANGEYSTGSSIPCFCCKCDRRCRFHLRCSRRVEQL
jgi:hypothetical protein